jgi:predicted nucleic-acid-binding protein
VLGLDTNVLVRYLVQDDPQQAQQASTMIRTRCTQDRPCFINRIVLCELVWVLETAYTYERGTIANVLERILRTQQFVIEDIDIVWTAWRTFGQSRADFADCLLGHSNRHYGCETTCTFDRDAGRLNEFFLL